MNYLILLALIVITFAEVTFINQFFTDPTVYSRYKKKIKQSKLTNTVISKQMYISLFQYTCYIPIKNTLLNHENSNITKQQPFEETMNLLTPLINTCAIHSTRQFIYEVCYNKLVRQFDDSVTFMNMGKSKYENILMGKKIKNQVSQTNMKNVISPLSMSIQNQYLFIQDGIGRTNFNLPFNKSISSSYILKTKCLKSQISLEILIVGNTEFVTKQNFVGYCFARKAVEGISLIYKNSIFNKGLYSYGEYLIGDCEYTAQHVLLKTDKDLDVYKIDKIVNQRTIKLSKNIVGRPEQCHKIQMDDGKTISKKLESKFSVHRNFLRSFDKIDLELGTELYLSYQIDEVSTIILERFTVHYKLSDTIYVLDHNPILTEGKNINIYVIGELPQQDYISKQYTLPYHFIKLENGQKLKLNSSQYFLTIIGNQDSIVKLVGQDWQYFIKEKSLKIKKYLNGSKQIVNENIYYENFTVEYIYHIYNALWRQNDFLEFYRLKIDQFNLIQSFGSAYIKIYNLNLQINQYIKQTQKTKIKRPSTNIKTFQIYEAGQFCGPPINRDRSTKVKYSCGPSWFTINKVSQIQPCSYQITIESLLLCQQSHQQNSKSEILKETICTTEQ